MENGADYPVGARIAFSTTLGEDFEGELILHDRNSRTLVLQEIGSSGSKRSLRFLKTSCVRDWKQVGQGGDLPDLRNLRVDQTLVQQREEAAIKQAELDAGRIGVGVSDEGQDIFDALGKTLPVRWEKTVIVVLDEVRISGPYRPENASGGNAQSLERVRKVLEQLRRQFPVSSS
ncbi:hypothetical protein KFL_002150140 [Klebsormidium nitens]|uniref:AD domain-containing protein n=1 Tax=Klebsormidium nitens TaxID=105231 RepID=A0A1Y1IA53_KLENI|nr:hypothetical protein KFL_002150140 [Klebsormidium nitens]|eukprot:GAQ84978.1 hypothetical protein KFL_002150140 [Klebsormidium nitens]